MLKLRSTSRVHGLAFSPEDRYLAAIGFGNRLTIFDLLVPNSVPREFTVPVEGSEQFRELWYLAHDRVAVSRWSDLVVFDVSSEIWRIVRPSIPPRRSPFLNYCPATDRIYSATDTLSAWSAVRSESALWSIGLRYRSGWFREAVASPDGTRVATIEQRQFRNQPRSTLHVRDASTGTDLGSRASWHGYGNGIVWSPDGRFIVGVQVEFRTSARSGYSSLFYWHESGEIVRDSARPPISMGCRRIAVDPAGKWVAIGGNGMVRFSDPRSGQVLRAYSWPISKVLAVAASNSGLMMAAGGGAAQHIIVWDLE